MGWFNNLGSELIDIIEWIDESNDTIVKRFERHDNEIKNGAQLIVRESQYAVFVEQGKFADVFTPGRYELKTENLPVLSTLKGWKYGFDSPFKAEVYFLSAKRLINLGWGTPNPIMMRDQDFGIVRVRSFGNFSIRIKDPKLFLSEISGTNDIYKTEEVQDYLRSHIISTYTDSLAEAKIPVLDLATQYEELGQLVSQRLETKIHKVGVELLDFVIENISLPDDVEEMIDNRSGMGAVGSTNFNQFQVGKSIEDAANNPEGSASSGIGMGLGFGMANNLMSQQQPPQPTQNTSPPPIGGTGVAYHVAINGQQHGPYSVADILSYIKEGRILADTKVWCEGMPGWTDAAQVGELSSAFGGGSAPPPLP